MTDPACYPSLYQQSQYQITVVGQLDENRLSWFEEWLQNCRVCTETQDNGPTLTTLCGLVKDQAALHGLLSKIRDLGLPLFKVEWLNTP